MHAGREELKLYRIINPCDPLTMRAPNLLIAGLACCAISTNFGVEGPDGESPVMFGWKPFFISQGVDVDNFRAALEEHSLAIADALESVLLGHPDLRHGIEEVLASLPDDAARRQFILGRNSAMRTGLLDIEGHAHKVAGAFRVAASRAKERA